MSITDVILLVYIAVAALVCVTTWIDNSQTYYACGNPPSGILYGFTWPFWVALAVVIIIMRATVCRPLPQPNPKPNNLPEGEG